MAPDGETVHRLPSTAIFFILFFGPAVAQDPETISVLLLGLSLANFVRMGVIAMAEREHLVLMGGVVHRRNRTILFF